MFLIVQCGDRAELDNEDIESLDSEDIDIDRLDSHLKSSKTWKICVQNTLRGGCGLFHLRMSLSLGTYSFKCFFSLCLILKRCAYAHKAYTQN